MKMHKDTYRLTTDLKSARLNYPNSTMQPFVFQNASGGLKFPTSALSYNKVKDIQRIFTRNINSIENLNYHERLRELVDMYILERRIDEY